MENKYVKLSEVEELLSLINTRDSYFEWSESFEKYDGLVKEAIIKLRNNAIAIGQEEQ